MARSLLGAVVVIALVYVALCALLHARQRWLLRDRYGSIRHLRGYGGPVLIVRAGRDEVIPAVNTDRLAASLSRPPRVVDLADADHNTLDGDPAYEAALADFLR